MTQVLEGHAKRRAVFHDWQDGKTYDPEARRWLTKWSAANVRKLQAIDILVSMSPVGALGVAAAALALKIVKLPLRSHTSRLEFESALERALGSSNSCSG